MDQELAQRWRLVLGRFANKNISDSTLTSTQKKQDQILEQLYKKELEKRGLRTTGTLDDSQLQAIDWLDKTDKLFPRSVSEKIQSHAVNDFGITSLLKNKKTLESMTPSMGLLKQLLAIRSQLNPELMQTVRNIIHEVVRELSAKLKPRFAQKLKGRLNRHQRSPIPVLANLDWQKTVYSNLKHFDPESKKLYVKNIYFSSRNQNQLPWRVILCIDQSGSMMDSIIYSAVIAGILTELPKVELKLILFDTNIVDLTDKAEDPVETLLSTQMGGGTHIQRAWQYCEEITEFPNRTVVATVSDFCEGGSPAGLIRQAEDMISAGIKMLGITAMTADALPFYDSYMTASLSKVGMDIASLSPDSFADWLAEAMEL